MSGIIKPQGGFVITPHKVSVCVILQVYAPPGHILLPIPFSSITQHNRLGLFLLALTKSCDDILEPTLDEFVKLLKDLDGLLDHSLSDNVTNHSLSDHVTSKLSSFSSPEDLFNFFSELRGILTGPETNVDDNQINLDPNSNLGMFLRRCLLAFNVLSFEGTCHLLTNIKTYCKEAFSSCPPYQISHLDDPSNTPVAPVEYENMDLENFVLKNFTEELESRKRSIDKVPFHNHSPKALFNLVEDIKVTPGQKVKQTYRSRKARSYMNPVNDALQSVESSDVNFLRTNTQIQGYLLEQANTIEKFDSSFPMTALSSVFKLLQKLAPELHGCRD